MDNYQTARTNGTLFANVNNGDPRKHLTLVCEIDGLYTGERVTEIDFEPEIRVDSMELWGENGQAHTRPKAQ